MSSAIVVTSGKGGTGKTSVTAGVATCLALTGYRVLCIDMDVGLRNLDLSLGMSDRALMDFTDVVDGRCSLSRAVVEHPRIPGLFLLSAPLTPRPVALESMKALIAEAKKSYDYILLDSPAGLGEEFRLAVGVADRALVVSTSDPSALRDAQRTVSVLCRTLPNRIHLVMNRIQPKLLKKLHTSIDAAMDTAGLPLIGVVPEDPSVILAAGSGIPLVLYTKKNAAAACSNITKRLLGQSVPVLKMR